MGPNCAGELIAHHGRNALTAEKPPPAWRRFLTQFHDPLVVLLLVATGISATLWVVERTSVLPYEAIAIFAVVLLNAVMGYVQRSRAEQAVAALRQMSAAHATAIRDGARQRIAASELVPGDIIVIEEGDTIPADARLVGVTALQTAEAALTGESLPVTKQTRPIVEEVGLGDRDNMVFSGTAASYGRGIAVVTATGMQSEVGRIAGMLQGAPEETTPLQKELARVARLLGLVVVVIAVIMIATIILIEDVRGFAALFDVLLFGVALAVAAVPEGLPAVVTAVLALGVQRMAQRNAIVRHLAAVETLGSAQVIASDKTGTLTKNEMTVRTVVTASGRAHFTGTGYAPQGEMVSELPALLVAARKAGLASEALDGRFKRVGEVPFSSDRKLMTTVYTDADREEHLRVFTKGAPDILLARCSRELAGAESKPLDETRRAQILKINEELAHDALRTLGVAFRSLPAHALGSVDIDTGLEQDLIFAGLVGMMDPPRPEAGEAVGRAKAAGIRPIMITGDHPVTAAVIAGELGIATDGRALTGAELEKMSQETLRRAVCDVSVYARVNPDHKLRIVRALQENGAIVAMTGDGVNDAPALKMADIGVAMGITGTDVSRQAADIVLTDDNFASIVAAVEEGRAIFANIRKFLRFLWINLVTDGAPALALGIDSADPEVMRQPPRPRGEGVMTRRMWMGIVYVGAIMAAGTLLVLDASLPGEVH